MIGPIISKKNQLETGLLFFLDSLLLTHWKASVWSPGGAVHSCCTSSSTLTHFTTTVNYFTKIYLFFTTWLEDQLKKWNFPLEVQSFGTGGWRRGWEGRVRKNFTFPNKISLVKHKTYLDLPFNLTNVTEDLIVITFKSWATLWV